MKTQQYATMVWQWAADDFQTTQKAIQMMSERHTFAHVDIGTVWHLFDKAGILDASCENTPRFLRLEAPHSWHNHPDHFKLELDMRLAPSTNFAEFLIVNFGMPGRFDLVEEEAEDVNP
jgi:hypothetical protein